MMEDQDGAELCFPQLLNISCRKPKLTQSDTVLLYFLRFISVLTVVLNLLVIISVSHFRQLHTPTNLLLLSLAVSDLLMGLTVTPLSVYNYIDCWFFGDIMCFLYVYENSAILSSSIANMVLISADRYVAICDPLHYPTRVTVDRVKMCICISWTCSFVYNILLFRSSLTHLDIYNLCYGHCLIFVDLTSGIADFFCTFIIPVTTIICLYMRVFVTAVSQARAMRSHAVAVTLQHSGSLMSKKSELKAARTLGVVVAVFLMCIGPFSCLSFVPSSVVNNLPAFSGIFMACISPFLNPLIYALFYPWFRKAIRLIVSLQILQPGSREINML